MRPSDDSLSGDAVDGRKLARYVLAGDFGVVVGLHVDEEHVAQTEGPRQTQCGVGADAAPKSRLDRNGQGPRHAKLVF